MLKLDVAWNPADAERVAQLREQLQTNPECSLRAAENEQEEREALAAIRCCASASSEKLRYVIVTAADIEAAGGKIKQVDGDCGPADIIHRHYDLLSAPQVAEALVHALATRGAMQVIVKTKEKVAPILRGWLEQGRLANFPGQEEKVRLQLGLPINPGGSSGDGA